VNNALILEGNKKTRTPNASVWYEYHKISKQLGARTDIIIKPSDKNLGVTVMNREWYLAEAHSQLNNPSVYTKISHFPNVTEMIAVLKSLTVNQSWLSQHKTLKLFKDLTIDHTLDRVKLCRIYFLPKLHKTPIGMRPICASQGWITYWTSVYIHLTVFPLLTKIPTYIANSGQLIRKLHTLKLPEHFQFIEADA
jgi:hypothetical protein